MIKTVGVVGAGTMGNGIAQVFAQAGFAVRLVDVAQPMLDRARQHDREEPRRSSSRRASSPPPLATRRSAGSRSTTSLDALADADYIVEAIVEDVDAKRALFARLDAHRQTRRDPRVEHLVDFDHGARRRDEAPRTGARHALHESRAADDARRADSRPGDVGRVDADRRRTCARARARPRSKRPTIPGFIANRILMPMINEAIFAVMEGVGTPEAIDTVMKLGMNHPMGPLTLADFIGLDVCLAILERAARRPRRSEVPPVSAAPAHGRGRTARAEVRPAAFTCTSQSRDERSAACIAISRRRSPGQIGAQTLASDSRRRAFGLRKEIPARDEPAVAERPEQLEARTAGRVDGQPVEQQMRGVRGGAHHATTRRRADVRARR